MNLDLLENWNKTLNHMLDLNICFISYGKTAVCKCPHCNWVFLRPSRLHLQFKTLSTHGAHLPLWLWTLTSDPPLLHCLSPQHLSSHPTPTCRLQQNDPLCYNYQKHAGQPTDLPASLANTATALCTDSRQIPTSGYFPSQGFSRVTPINLWTLPLAPTFVAAC